MDVPDSPLTRLLKSVLSIEERNSGAYEDATKPPSGGKWSEAGVPHRGWEVVECFKLEDREQLCEMCERQHVMFVHVMRHENYHDDLRVGCVCAGHMEEDMSAAHQREVQFRNRSKRRANWLNRKWKRSVYSAGSQVLRTDGMQITVYPSGNHWAAAISHRASGHRRHSKLFYKTADEAKLAAFDVMMDWLKRKPWTRPGSSRRVVSR